jgi:hypothetical protein
MRIDRGSAAVILLSLGAAALVLAKTGDRPQPCADGPVDPGLVLPDLRAAADQVDAACGRGDLAAFAAVTTAAHRRELERQLQVVDGAADGALLRDLGRARQAGRWLDGDRLAAHAQAGRLVVAMQRANDQGVQLVAFVWDGRRWRYDGARQAAPGLAPAAAVEAAAARR